MKIRNIKLILLKQVAEFKIRLLIFIPLYFILILIFIIAELNNKEFADIELMKNVKEYYHALYQNYNDDILNYIIFLDTRLMNYLIITTFIIPLFWTVEMIVKEKEERTIEHLFVLPVKDSEIIFGKMLLSIISTINLILVLYLISYVFAYVKYPPPVSKHMLSFKWISIIIFGTPLLSLFINFIAIIISSLTNKFQTSQYLAIIFLSPFFVLYLLIMNGTLIFDDNYIIAILIILLLIDFVFLKFVTKLFNREKILLRI